ncbi:MAG: rRNA maturation RNase YbeY [Alphaproteobacteria bacterium]|nr:rRNA maturation RNase YbeY [Alphaproteobacteria bacterium]
MNLVNVNIADDTWNACSRFDEWQSLLLPLLDCTVGKLYEKYVPLEVNLLLTNSEDIRELNRKFRNVDATTNVLSFPQYEPDIVPDILQTDDKIATPPNKNVLALGDIAMARGKIMEECREYGLEFFDRCSHLFVHGAFHLLGLDHMNQEDECKMENLEIQVLGEFGIDNPYISKERSI